MGLSLPFHKWGKRGTREQLARGAKQVPGRAQGTVGMWNTHEKQNARWEGEALRQLQPPYPIPEKSQHDTLASTCWSIGSRAALSHQRPTQSQNQTSIRYHSGLPLQITAWPQWLWHLRPPILGQKEFLILLGAHHFPCCMKMQEAANGSVTVFSGSAGKQSCS